MVKVRQILLLLWKNYKLQFRHPFVTFLELGVPAFFSLCMVLIRSIISSEYVSEPTVYNPFNVGFLPRNLTPSNYSAKWDVLYVPNTGLANKIMEDVAIKLDVNHIGFPDEDELLEYYNENTNYVLSGIIFEYGNNSNTMTNLSYTIRPKTAEGGNTAFKNTLKTWFTEMTFPVFPALGPRNKGSGWGGSPGYMSQGFLPLQHAIAMSTLQNIPSNFSEDHMPNVQMCRYPYPPYLDDNFILALQFFLPMIICFSFIYPAVNIVKNLVVEKEKRMKEAMKMMGLCKWLHWVAWYLKFFVFLSISCGIVTILLCVKFKDLAVINSSDPSVILMYLILYSASTICFCFLLSTLFSKANSSAAGAGVIFFLSFMPYFFILPRYNQMSYSEKLVSCLLPNVAVAVGSVVLTVSEASGAGLQWDNIYRPVTPDDTLSMSMIFTMFVIDAVVCLILAWYIEAVFPGEYGVPEPWYFPFTRTYWCGQTTDFSDMVQFFNSDDKRSEFFEQDPVELLTGIQIQGLTKVFGKGMVPAVNNVNMNMYRSHITVLLGHNGAGKTTTISMLTGLIPPTSGTATVNGFDIQEDMDSVHSSLGICPQHDILFDELTVEEHLYFFCKLKGYISDLVPSEIDRVISSLGLEGKRNIQTRALSGGWKRKLSVGIALVGGSRIVILDEPTSGMDPFNRRSLWDVLQTEKEDRTILLTTHFMEEADVLGDRIAIMANGEVQCCGSPLFLKKKYGAGYHLVMVKEPSCDASLISQLVQFHVPNAEMSSNIGSELKYILPHDSSNLFFSLFSELEKRKEELNISGYGASITTMEEVFLKVGRIVISSDVSETSEANSHKESFSPTDSGVHVNSEITDDFSGTEVDLQSIDYQTEERNAQIYLFGQQLFALLQKRILHSYRNWLLTSSQLILPPFFLIITLLMLKTLPKPHDSPPLLLSVKSFQGTAVPYAVNFDFSESKLLGNIYALQFNGLDKPVLVNSSANSLTQYLINEAKKDLGIYNMHNMIGAKFDHEEGSAKTTITSMFNNQAYHSPAISLLEVDNAILKYFTDETRAFSVTNYPLPRTVSEKGKQQQTQTTESYQISQDIMFGMSFLIASFAVFIVKERSSNSKHLQRVSGVNLFSYWLASFIWDFCNYLVPCCLLLLIFYAFSTDGLSSSEEIGRLFLLFFVHGFSALPFVYCCTFFFLSPSTAYVRLSLFNILVGIACLLTITILEIPDLGVEYVAKPLDYVFSILIPNFSLGRAVSNLYQNHQFIKICTDPNVVLACALHVGLAKPCCKDYCGDTCIPWEENYLSITSPGIGKQLIFFVVQFVVFSCLLVLCERNLFRYLKYKLKTRKVRPSSVPSVVETVEITAIEDDDVCTERMMILNSDLNNLFLNNHLIVKQLTKNYGSLVAVDKLSFGVRKGECFGLLGLNGAGKTTTFKMITGDEAISDGEVYVDSCDIKKESRKVQTKIGYCPQFDALIDQLTGKETLTLFARLRGIPEYLIPGQIASLAELLSFHVHINKQVKDYSGGNKRKLSTAVALVGNPPLVFLDEPTTGMDPVSRRCMWKALLRVLESGRSIVLTSHSMEECEALCSRLVIMVNGKLCCLGSPQYLKSKFGQGFTLMIKVGRRPLSRYSQMKNAFHETEETAIYSTCNQVNIGNAVAQDVNDVRAFVERTFASSVLKNVHETLLHYHIPNPQLNWSEIFRIMEEAKASLNIEDYSVGETTLEQVFLNFALVQRNAEILL